MTTLQQLQALSEAELATQVAVDVLGWTITGKGLLGDTLGVPPEGLEYLEIARPIPDVFNDWNDLMEVIEAMRERHLAGALALALCEVLKLQPDEPLNSYVFETLRASPRDICIAALLTVSQSQP